ncbi:hypothetical protein BCR33DRAFT_724442 [Rhizoclosmatium globosum]|uniref:Ysc84 actin-binding domain-containing protein n=1 Tax=Rhizoclosmatium globosum TaxID=329046 RepID=A0A1Y2B7Q7_9FUNG|nr:hypothetical protein BCR33DRAFT_724442 [Rhizoclosmatium globosum]|eukprot:ORY30135.1 hypothetical protein BCR33DRAFT_724442 [Rhizoclosmatium globosum]
MHSTNPQAITEKCAKAVKILETFVEPGQSGSQQHIPPQIIDQAKGIVILSVVRAGIVLNKRGGSGLVMVRLPDGSWSAPSAISTDGFGAGLQIGTSKSNLILLFRRFVVGPSRNNSGKAINEPIYLYSTTNGIFIGISLKESVLTQVFEDEEANSSFYGPQVSAKDILSGFVKCPTDAEPLYRLLSHSSEY